MNNQITLKNIFDFFLTKIIIGIVVVGGSVALVEWVRQFLPVKNQQAANDLTDGVIGIAEIFLAVLSYILFSRYYEKRQITELSLTVFWKNALMGLLTGLILQSLVIIVLYLAGGYFIIQVNPLSFLIPGFTAAIIAGFVAEIMIRGLIFRLTEEKLGTEIALIISVLLFVVMHSGVQGPTLLGVMATSIQAGILFSAVYVFSRSLWFPVFLHFAWDFAEPGIYGGVNPGISIEKSLFNSKITGSPLLTGGQFGPGNSIQAALFCLITGILFLWLAKRKNNFIKPYWKK
jgi:membrane protease YdiL (CAAX protease family)